MRLDLPDTVPAGQRVVRARRALPQAYGRDAAATGSGTYRALPRPAGAHSAATGVEDATRSDERSPATYYPAQHVRDAYRATDPVQPRPGLYLHVRA